MDATSDTRWIRQLQTEARKFYIWSFWLIVGKVPSGFWYHAIGGNSDALNNQDPYRAVISIDLDLYPLSAGITMGFSIARDLLLGLAIAVTVRSLDPSLRDLYRVRYSLTWSVGWSLSTRLISVDRLIIRGKESVDETVTDGCPSGKDVFGGAPTSPKHNTTNAPMFQVGSVGRCVGFHLDFGAWKGDEKLETPAFVWDFSGVSVQPNPT